jgi:hypothetical protein
MTTQNVASIHLTRDVADLVHMRSWLSHHLPRACRPDLHDDVLLLATELVTNTVNHTRSMPVLTLTVSEAIRVAVDDEDPTPPVVEPLAPGRPRGNGMRIIEAWASTWGTDARPHGKTVWFETPRW